MVLSLKPTVPETFLFFPGKQIVCYKNPCLGLRFNKGMTTLKVLKDWHCSRGNQRAPTLERNSRLKAVAGCFKQKWLNNDHYNRHGNRASPSNEPRQGVCASSTCFCCIFLRNKDFIHRKTHIARSNIHRNWKWTIRRLWTWITAFDWRFAKMKPKKKEKKTLNLADPLKHRLQGLAFCDQSSLSATAELPGKLHS